MAGGKAVNIEKRIAIVGSRTWQRPNKVRDFVDLLPRDTIVVSGGARGVDQIAEQRAKQRGLKVESFPADWKSHGKAAGFMRNSDIVKAADAVVAFWDGKSNGTADTVKKTQAANKPLIILGDNHQLTQSDLVELIWDLNELMLRHGMKNVPKEDQDALIKLLAPRES
jgi:hypothetical protein